MARTLPAALCRVKALLRQRSVLRLLDEPCALVGAENIGSEQDRWSLVQDAQPRERSGRDGVEGRSHDRTRLVAG